MGLPAIAAIAAPLVASAVSSMLSSGGDDEKAIADNNKVREMQRAGGETQIYRGQMAEAQMQSLANRMQAYQGANNALATMYGPGAAQAPQIGLGANALGLPTGVLNGPAGAAPPPGGGGGPPPGAGGPPGAAPPGMPRGMLPPPNQLGQRTMPSTGAGVPRAGVAPPGPVGRPSPFDDFLNGNGRGR